MRGKAIPHFFRYFQRRITPAYAGKSVYRWVRFFIVWDHPRLCGEKYTACKVPFVEAGSPPPMRGKGHLQLIKPQPAGITPAYAGKSIQADYSGRSTRDHPRLCGEKDASGAANAVWSGSPPPMRGKADGELGTEDALGITPAYAGKRFFIS